MKIKVENILMQKLSIRNLVWLYRFQAKIKNFKIKILIETKEGISWQNKNLSRQHKIAYMYAPN